jgi:hypothetical protein
MLQIANCSSFLWQISTSAKADQFAVMDVSTLMDPTDVCARPDTPYQRNQRTPVLVSKCSHSGNSRRMVSKTPE